MELKAGNKIGFVCLKEDGTRQTNLGKVQEIGRPKNINKKTIDYWSPGETQVVVKTDFPKNETVIIRLLRKEFDNSFVILTDKEYNKLRFSESL